MIDIDVNASDQRSIMVFKEVASDKDAEMQTDS